MMVPLARVDGDDRTTPSQDDVDPPGGVLGEAAWLVAVGEHDRRADGARPRIDQVHLIPIGIADRDRHAV